LVVGLGLLAWSVFAAISSLDLLSVGARAQGTITRVDMVQTEVDRTYRDASGNERTRRERVSSPVSTIRFRAEDERTYEFTAGSISERESVEHKVGNKVDVIYDPANPQNASIDNAWAQWQPPLMLSLAGLVFFVTGMMLFRLVFYTRPSGEVDEHAVQNSRSIRIIDTVWIVVWNIIVILATALWLTQSRLEATWQYLLCLGPALIGGLMLLPGLVLTYRRRVTQPAPTSTEP
jgi:hypothetical protein